MKLGRQRPYRLLFIFFFSCSLFSAEAPSDNPQTTKQSESRQRARDLGITVGTMKTGPFNAITDVRGIAVGHKTLIIADSIRTGVTAILPHQRNIYQEKVPAAIYCFNAFGKLAGSTQVEELGNIETPIILTNTLSVGTAMSALVAYTLVQKGNSTVRSVNAIVGETNDGYLNDIRGQHIAKQDVLAAISFASEGPVVEGSIGAGTGTSAFGFKGGIGTASRRTPPIGRIPYTVGVLVQTNFGRELSIIGIPFSVEMNRIRSDGEDGSCMIVIATDAPLSARNLKRLAKRSFAGMARTCAFMSNGSGDFAIAFSTAYVIPHSDEHPRVTMPPVIHNDAMNIFFRAVEEAVQEAIYNSLFMATTVSGYKGHRRDAIPLDQVLFVMKKYNRFDFQPKLK